MLKFIQVIAHGDFVYNYNVYMMLHTTWVCTVNWVMAICLVPGLLLYSKPGYECTACSCNMIFYRFS